MKCRLSAVLLALGLSVSVLSMGVYAEETETAATEQATEAATEAETLAAEEELQEVESELAEAAGEAEGQTEAASMEDQVKTMVAQYLTEISSYTDEQLDEMANSDTAYLAAIAANWSSVKEELGSFVEVSSVEITEYTSTRLAVTSHAKYEKVSDGTDVVVTFEVDNDAQTMSFNWEVDYPMGLLMQRAALNTIMGIGIVFITLLFLSFLISKLHIIPDMIEKRSKSNEPAPAPAPVAAPAAAAVVEEEDLTDDLELVAVITAAIAASENTSADGFQVRSIKKANKRNWQRA